MLYTTLHTIIRTSGRPSITRTLDSLIRFPAKVSHVVTILDNTEDGAARELYDHYGPAMNEVGVRLGYAHIPKRSHGHLLNAGRAACVSHFTHILDDDDFLTGNFYQEAMNALADRRYGAALVAHFHQREMYGPEGVITPLEVRRVTPPAYLSLSEGLESCAMVSSCVLYRTYLHDVVGDFDEELRVGEDTDFFIRLHAQKEVNTVQTPLVCRTVRLASQNDSITGGLSDAHLHRVRLLLRDKYLREGFRRHEVSLGSLLHSQSFAPTQMEIVDVLPTPDLFGAPRPAAGSPGLQGEGLPASPDGGNPASGSGGVPATPA